MKLRIKGNSLRVRLTQQETKRLAEEGSVENETDFGGRIFRFEVRTREGVDGVSACFDESTILVVAPQPVAAQWATGSAVGFYGEQPTSTGGVLTIAVEKDFRCLDPRRDEDESDHFDNPLAGQSLHTACEHAED